MADVNEPTDNRLPRRRDILALLGLGAAAAQGVALAGCRKRSRAGGTAINVQQLAELMPHYEPRPPLEPDIPGDGPIPDAYLRYPRELLRSSRQKPGRGGPPITAMMPRWGPTPPGLGRNSFLDAVNAELGVVVSPSLQDGRHFGAKLSAVLSARDMPDLLTVPSWVIDRVPRFSQAVEVLCEDLTPHLRGGAIAAYPRLAAIPTAAWQHSVWNGRLAAVPLPKESPFPWALFYRRDMTERAGVRAPENIDDLYRFGLDLTDARRGVWAFGNIFMMVQMFFCCPCPNAAGGWRENPGGGLAHRYELPEYRQAVEFTARLYREGLVHPDVQANPRGDATPLFNAGRIIAHQDGLGAWLGLQREQARVTPGFDIQPMSAFSALAGEPRSWVHEVPKFYTFLKKGLGPARVQELLRVLDWCAAPFGSREHELLAHGVEHVHFTRARDGSPVATALGQREVAEQYLLLGGRPRSLVVTADAPNFVPDYLAYARATLAHREPDPFQGIKLELPAKYSTLMLNMEDQLHDFVLGRRPLSELEGLVRHWRRSGGDEARAFLAQEMRQQGLEPWNVMTNPDTFILLATAQALWKDVGWASLVFMAALTSIDPALHEAAAVDGATGYRRMLHVTLPALRPVIVLLLILRLGDALSVGFEQFLLQRDAVGMQAAEVLDTYVYHHALLPQEWGVGAAAGLLKAAVGLVLMVTCNRLAHAFGEPGLYSRS